MIETIRNLVRPFMAVSFVGTTIYLAVTAKIEPGKLLSITGMIVAFYFGERSALKGVNNNAKVCPALKNPPPKA
jgi:hypothetical protein